MMIIIILSHCHPEIIKFLTLKIPSGISKIYREGGALTRQPSPPRRDAPNCAYCPWGWPPCHCPPCPCPPCPCPLCPWIGVRRILNKTIIKSLQLALDSARFEFTLKMRLNRIWPKDPTYAIFLKSWVFKDVKYDIPMCQCHSTRPQPIQLVPTMQKKLFTLSFQPKFLKIWFTKVAASRSFLMTRQFFFLLLAKWSQGHVWAK